MTINRLSETFEYTPIYMANSLVFSKSQRTHDFKFAKHSIKDKQQSLSKRNAVIS